jgi:hypothetical protein
MHSNQDALSLSRLLTDLLPNESRFYTQLLLQTTGAQRVQRAFADAYSDQLVASERALDHTLRRTQKPAIHAFTRNRHAAQMHFIQYFCLDVIFVWSSLAAFVLYAVLRLVFAFSRFIFDSRE